MAGRGSICAIYGCNNYRQQSASRSFYRFPKNKEILWPGSIPSVLPSAKEINPRRSPKKRKREEELESETTVGGEIEVAGAAAGLMVDLTLFPLDTLKTRLQSEKGFLKAGGLKGIYKGVGPTILASAPSAAIFFVTYDKSKKLLETKNERIVPVSHMASASVAEIASNLVRVPMEIVKQRRQTSDGISPLNIVRKAVENEGFLGLYRGFFSTVMRDIPFSIIQFPLWEALKLYWSTREMREVTSAESALAGAIAGSVAGAFTTPLDVAKTRIMLTEHNGAASKNLQTINILKEIYRSQGIQGLFAGFIPRTTMIFCGGGIFFGCYEYTKGLLLT